MHIKLPDEPVVQLKHKESEKIVSSWNAAETQKIDETDTDLEIEGVADLFESSPLSKRINQKVSD